MPEYEEVVAEIAVPVSALSLAPVERGHRWLSDPSAPSIVPDDGSRVKLVLTGLMDTEEVETHEQALRRKLGVSDDDPLPNAVLRHERVDERYALRGSLVATSVRLEIIG